MFSLVLQISFDSTHSFSWKVMGTWKLYKSCQLFSTHTNQQKNVSWCCFLEHQLCSALGALSPQFAATLVTVEQRTDPLTEHLPYGGAMFVGATRLLTTALNGQPSLVTHFMHSVVGLVSIFLGWGLHECSISSICIEVLFKGWIFALERFKGYTETENISNVKTHPFNPACYPYCQVLFVWLKTCVMANFFS